MIKLRKKWVTLAPTLRWMLIIFFYLALIGVYLLWHYQRPSGAALYGHNHTDRPIFSYWVNDHWGGNGGMTCCWRIQSDTLKVEWVVSRSREQIDQGAEQKRQEMYISNPPRQSEDQYLHVHFLPGNQVRLSWSHTVTSPLARELAKHLDENN